MGFDMVGKSEELQTKKKKTGSVLMGEVVVLMTLVLSTVHLLILLHRVDSHRKVAF